VFQPTSINSESEWLDCSSLDPLVKEYQELALFCGTPLDSDRVLKSPELRANGSSSTCIDILLHISVQLSKFDVL